MIVKNTLMELEQESLMIVRKKCTKILALTSYL